MIRARSEVVSVIRWWFRALVGVSCVFRGWLAVFLIVFLIGFLLGFLLLFLRMGFLFFSYL